MGKAFRKPRPSAPIWAYYYEQCALCKHPNGCSNCKENKDTNDYVRRKRDRLEKQRLRQLTA